MMRQNSNKVNISCRVFFDAFKALVKKLVFEERFCLKVSSYPFQITCILSVYFLWYIWIYYLSDFDQSLESIKNSAGNVYFVRVLPRVVFIKQSDC